MVTKVTIDQLYPEMEEATVGAWFKAEGDPVALGERLVEIITDKVAFELESEGTGVVRQVWAAEKSVVPIGYTIALIGEPTDELPEVDEENARLLAERQAALAESAGSAITAAQVREAAPAAPVRATPAARRLARNANVDLVEVAGTGPEGTITEADVRAAIDARESQS
jgi:pyruvate dehydrogenase E2 component (dihydrolipoamide acetyltransferase)